MYAISKMNAAADAQALAAKTQMVRRSVRRCLATQASVANTTTNDAANLSGFHQSCSHYAQPSPDNQSLAAAIDSLDV